MVRWTVHIGADVLKNGDKNSDVKKDNDPDNKSSANEGE